MGVAQSGGFAHVAPGSPRVTTRLCEGGRRAGAQRLR
jgi:hypothetical protein